MTRPLILTLACVPVVACSTLGGTVRGDFSCRAVSGSCAPLSINDAAALEAGRTLERQGPKWQRGFEGPALRTGERLLTILLPAHVDQEGVLHDAATVHVVAEPARWDSSAARSTLSDILPFSRGPALSPREIIGAASASLMEEPEPSPARAPQPSSTRPSVAALEAARAGHRIAAPSLSAPASDKGVPKSEGPVVQPLGQAPLAAPRESGALPARKLPAPAAGDRQ